MGKRARRPLKRLFFELVVAGLAIVLVGGAIGHWVLPSSAPVSREVINTAAVEESPSSLGVAEGADLFFMSQADVDRTLDTLQSLGVKNVRIAIFWAGVEATEGEYDWTNVDRMVDAATERGMGILGNINHTPEWAGTPYLTGHPDPAQYGAFVGAVAERYKGKISAYEIWNEPTTTVFWDPVDPVAYTELLKAGYTAIKAVDQSATVIGGSVVAGPTRDGSTLDPVSFIRAMYDAGAQGYFDALSYHPYLFNTPFSEGAGKPDFDYPIEQLQMIRDLMASKGDSDVKVWITEYGQPTTTLADGTVLSEQQQAAYIADLVRTWQGVDGAGPVFIYNTRDTQSGSSNPDYNLGLYYSDWTPKLSADMMAQLVKELAPVDTPDPVNPIVAFFQQIFSAVQNALSGIPKLFNQVFTAVANWLGSLFGVRPTSAAATVAPATSAVATTSATSSMPAAGVQPAAIAVRAGPVDDPQTGEPADGAVSTEAGAMAVTTAPTPESAEPTELAEPTAESAEPTELAEPTTVTGTETQLPDGRLEEDAVEPGTPTDEADQTGETADASPAGTTASSPTANQAGSGASGGAEDSAGGTSDSGGGASDSGGEG